VPVLPRDLPAAIPGEVDVHFLNGSIVRMIVHSDKLEVATQYGKLAVPIKDIRAIEFGLHYPDGAAEKIATAVKNLGSDIFQDREDAIRALIDFGSLAYPAVLAASKEKDPPQISIGANEVLKKLQAKLTKADLKTSAEDKIITPKFTIVGDILTPTIKAKADYFGDVELSLAKMRILKAVGGPSMEVQVSIDASQYAVHGRWLDTKFRVESKAVLQITASGGIDMFPNGGGGFNSGPAGFNAMRGGGRPFFGKGNKLGFINPNQHGGMLIGKIGEDGEPFFIGESYDGSQEAEGNLYLHIGPSQWGMSVGSYEVKINRK
jgi:hypothetical protein